MKRTELLKTLEKRLSVTGINNPLNESEIILSHVLGLKRSLLYLDREQEVCESELGQIESIVEDRIKQIPLQYILGETEFYGLRIKVDSSVLIPRPETESMVQIIARETGDRPVRVLDLGTGSGAIAISLAFLMPEAEIEAVDISEPAIETAIANAEMNRVKVQFYQSDLFEKVKGRYDLIVSNPPYISESEYSILPIEVREHEPKLALLAGDNGLEFYRKILKKAKEYLTSEGLIYFEISESLSGRISETARKYSFDRIRIFKDLAGRKRTMQIG